MAKIIRRRPSDVNQRAKNVVDIATQQTEDNISESEAKSAAAALGRRGGLKGGPARAKTLSPKRRKEIAKKAAKARWHNNGS